MDNPNGPTMEQGALLVYIRGQGTPADVGDGAYNKTPVQFASQQRMVVWLMYVPRRTFSSGLRAAGWWCASPHSILVLIGVFAYG